MEDAYQVEMPCRENDLAVIGERSADLRWTATDLPIKAKAA
ncbi:hypothetical protein Verru16b_03040 [Lacunisphaera limnophila]|uniref:Uncharacterized protein n=1 Tax=Lacunisphaera limnophila TaxID=1838286 RepID=A0A1D8AYH3_9BACT|nr:hypothetical protein Verru16b_03040 [Lacunisphaera limnophila]